MKKVMITTAAVALAFGLSPFAGAQDQDVSNHSTGTQDNRQDNRVSDSLNDNSDNRKTITKTDTDTRTIT
ncbi:MAG TPA: hypothetical protein VFU48_14880, partial [Nitrospira sp.]|nr:hypothetical protein [Nitrospira sp.]